MGSGQGKAWQKVGAPCDAQNPPWPAMTPSRLCGHPYPASHVHMEGLFLHLPSLLGPGDPEVNKRDRIPAFQELEVIRGMQIIRKINAINCTVYLKVVSVMEKNEQ